MKHIIYLVAFFCQALLFPLPAQQVLTLKECRQMALENNKHMAIAAANRQKAGLDVNGYKANYLPKLSVTGNYLFSSAVMKKTIPASYLPTFVPDANGQLVPNILTTTDGVPLFKEYAFFPGMDLNLKLNGTYIAGVQLEQPIYMGGKITSAYHMAKIGEEIALLNEEKTRAEVILQTDESYWTYIQMLELVKTAHAYKKMVAQLLVDVGNAYDAGMKPRNDLLKAQVKHNEAELQVMKAENGVHLSRMNLCHVIGLPLTTAITTTEKLDAQDFERVLTADITSRPEYAMLSRQIALKEDQIKLARSEFLPHVGVVGNFGYANGLELNGSKLLDHAAFSAVVSVSIPLFHWGEGLNKARSAMIEKNMASLQRDDLSEKMELELQQAAQALNESELEVRLTSRSLMQAEENRKESRNRYDAGMETMSGLLEAQTMWLQANSALIRAKTAARLSETRYLKAAGRL